MNTTLQVLIKLQDIDKVIMEIQHKIDEFPEAIQQLNELLAEEERKVAQLQASIDEQEKTRRSKESTIEANLEQTKKYQGQLLQVKTNKEYSALLAEIKSLKSKDSLHEDDILELMESVERAKKALATVKEELVQTKQRVEEAKQKQAREQKGLEEQQREQQQIRDNLAKNVEAHVLKEYTKLLTLRHGMAVSKVGDGGICSGCHVSLTPQMHAEIRTGDYLHRCPICFRFLYWADTDSSIQGE